MAGRLKIPATEPAPRIPVRSVAIAFGIAAGGSYHAVRHDQWVEWVLAALTLAAAGEAAIRLVRQKRGCENQKPAG